jgi:putative transposase
MSRPLRIKYPGAFYHIMNRGADRVDVFHDPNFFQLFFDVITD